MTNARVVFFMLLLSSFCFVVSGWTIEGGISFDPTPHPFNASGPVVVQLFALRVNDKQQPITLTFKQAWGVLNPPIKQITVQMNGVNPTEFSFDSVNPGYYSVLAFLDTNGNKRLDLDQHEPLGWYRTDPIGWLAPLNVRNNVKVVDIVLRKTQPFNAVPTRKADHGLVRELNGRTILQLWGTPSERGFAHGYLVGPQIVDFFVHFMLETVVASTVVYNKEVQPFLRKNFTFPVDLMNEATGIVAGMKAAGVPIYLSQLGREMDPFDILAVNTYLEIEYFTYRGIDPTNQRKSPTPTTLPGGAQASKSACTQFVVWQGETASGSLLAGRNMDGELDIFKVTVSHLLVFAIEPSLQHGERKKLVNVMWPGFIGSLSGVNEDGIYSMMNYGSTGPGMLIRDTVPLPWTEKVVLVNTSLAEATPDQVLAKLNKFKSAAGGLCGTGCIVTYARPYTPGNNTPQQAPPAFFYEGDYSGGLMRLAGDTLFPFSTTAIMASNHFIEYGVNPTTGPSFNFGEPVGLDSLWRYTAGANAVDAFNRTGRHIDEDGMVRLLQTVAEGTTEHSILYIPSTTNNNDHVIRIAAANMQPRAWDGPFMPWDTFKFGQLFLSH